LLGNQTLWLRKFQGAFSSVIYGPVTATTALSLFVGDNFGWPTNLGMVNNMCHTHPRDLSAQMTAPPGKWKDVKTLCG